MEPNNNNNNVIITEDGQRLALENGLIKGTDDAKPGLAHETGNVLDENNDGGGACPTQPGKANGGKGERGADF